MSTTKKRVLVFLVMMLAGSMVVAAFSMAADSEATTAADISTADEAIPFDPFEEGGDDPFEQEDESLRTVADPLIGFNRAMFTVNDRLYFWMLKPVATGYRFVVPTPVRSSIKNFFFNLLGPVRFANCMLQGKWSAAEGEFGRFLTNTTIGMLGLLDATKNYPELNPPVEDMGQTLGHYGAGSGFYIVWPLLGPSTLRDTVGTIGDWALNPFTYIQMAQADTGSVTSRETSIIVYGVRTINETSFRIGDYETLKNAALDPYAFMRDAYIQNRNSKIAE